MATDPLISDLETTLSNLSTDPRPYFRSEPVVSLSGSKVVVLGCGSVGSLAAWGLASAGIGALTLIDRDRLEPGNLRRHICGVESVGVAKAVALVRFLGECLPTTAFEAHDMDVLERPDELRVLIGQSEAVLVAVDAEGPKHLTDAMARELGKPVVYVGVYGGGWAGEVILSDTEARTTCYACAARALGRVGNPLSLEDLAPGYALPVAGVPESDWPRADLTSLMPIAALATRVVVARLLAARGQRRCLAELTGGGTSAWRLPLREVPGWGRPWTLVPCQVVRFLGCQGC